MGIFLPVHQSGPLVNLSPPGQNGRHFTDDILRCIFVNSHFVFWLKFHWNLFPMIQLIIAQHWLRQWLGTSHYLNQCWPSSRTHICGTRGRWVKLLLPQWHIESKGNLHNYWFLWHSIAYSVQSNKLTLIYSQRTHWALNKMADILQITFSDAFIFKKKMKISERRTKFDWIASLRFNWWIASIGSGNCLVLNRPQAIMWIQWVNANLLPIKTPVINMIDKYDNSNEISIKLSIFSCKKSVWYVVCYMQPY